MNGPGHRPIPGEIRLMRVALAPWRWMTAPRISGMDHVPVDRPALLAGNHTTLALLDSPLLLLAFHEALGVYPRTVGDHLHFRIPAWRTLVARFGVIDGTPDHVRALVRAGDSIVVFPGGAREVFKRRGEKYTLLWGTGAALRASRSRTGIRSCRSRSLAPRTSTISCSMRRTSSPRRSARCSGGSHRTPTSSRPSFADSGRRRCPGSNACTSTSPPR